MFKISHNFRYMMANGYIYDATQDQSFHIDSLNESFWINFYKENIISSFIHEMYDETKIKSILRELNNTFSEGLNENFVFRQNLTFEKTLDTKFDKENITSIVESIFDSLGQTIILQEENWLSRTWGKVKSGVSNAFNWIKDKGLDYFFENLRKALFSWGGVAIQTFLATIGASLFGIGPIINEVMWILMLTYDLFKAITAGDWGFERILNIIIDIVGIVTAGPGAGIISGFLKKGGQTIMKSLGTLTTNLGLKGGSGRIAAVLTWLRTAGGKVGNIINTVFSAILGGVQKIFITPLKAAGKWFEKNFKSKWVSDKTQSVSKFVTDLSSKIKTTSNIPTDKIKNLMSTPTGKSVKDFAVQGAIGAGASYALYDKRAFAGAYKDEFDSSSYISPESEEYKNQEEYYANQSKQGN
jgi:hypothetical protein